MRGPVAGLDAEDLAATEFLCYVEFMRTRGRAREK
jgi:hypothetical protein